MRHPEPVNGRALAIISVAICLALAAVVIAIVLAKSRAQKRDLSAPIAYESYDERATHMGWTMPGAPSRAEPTSEPSASDANQSLPPPLMSTAPSEPRASAAPQSAPAPQPNVVVIPEPAPAALIVNATPEVPSATNHAAQGSPTPNHQNPNSASESVARGEEPCGPTVCTGGRVCCNASCGTCVEPGQKCSQAVCGMDPLPQSTPCGMNTCNVGDVCCNASCGTCTKFGESCDQRQCDDAIQYPYSQSCGLTTCNVGMVCCNPSCGICAAPGEPCSQNAC
jgi:hypothetical protein